VTGERVQVLVWVGGAGLSWWREYGVRSTWYGVEAQERLVAGGSPPGGWGLSVVSDWVTCTPYNGWSQSVEGGEAW
jgi:hypothetical protein